MLSQLSVTTLPISHLKDREDTGYLSHVPLSAYRLVTVLAKNLFYECYSFKCTHHEVTLITYAKVQ